MSNEAFLVGICAHRSAARSPTNIKISVKLRRADRIALGWRRRAQQTGTAVEALLETLLETLLAPRAPPDGDRARAGADSQQGSVSGCGMS